MNPHATARCDFQLSGFLIDKAQARHRIVDSGLALPVLCFSLQTDSSTGAVCHVQQLFEHGHEKQCEAAAARLHKNARVTIIAPSVGLELVARNVSHVHLHPADEADSAPARKAVPA